MSARSVRDARAGFSLVELLVIIAILGVLVGLGSAALMSARSKADRSVAISNLRQIGAALHQYCADHSGRLPGPMWPGQIPVPDPQRAGRLVRELAGYLGIEPGSEPASVFVPPAVRRVMAASSIPESRPYVLNMAVANPGAAPLTPWGNLASGGGEPLPIAAVPASGWAMSDADQLHPRVLQASWRANTPPAPVHGPNRMALQFSGSVEMISRELLE